MTSLTLQHSDTDSFPFLRSRLVLVKQVQIVHGHLKKVSIVELDHGYAVCGLKNCTDIHTHARTKFSIEHTSVGLAHARPIIYVNSNVLN